MINFFRDLVADLKGRPLLAAAAGAMLVALLAVALLLPKPAKQPAPAPPPPAKAAPVTANGPAGYESIAAVQPIAAPGPAFPAQKKKDDKFARKNPFAGLPAGAGAAGQAGVLPPGSQLIPTSGTGLYPQVPPGTDGGDTGGGSTSYHYVVTARFGEEGKKQKDKKLTALRALPDSNSAVIVFLGVRSDGKTAVFLMSSSATTTGDGTCVPSDDECSFLYLKKGDIQTVEVVSADGEVTTYELKLVKISLRRTTRQPTRVTPARGTPAPRIQAPPTPAIRPRARPRGSGPLPPSRSRATTLSAFARPSDGRSESRCASRNASPA